MTDTTKPHPDLQAARLNLLTTAGKPLTQRQLGALMDIASNAVSAIECGRKPAPVRYERLLRAYTARHRPTDWPE